MSLTNGYHSDTKLCKKAIEDLNELVEQRKDNYYRSIDVNM